MASTSDLNHFSVQSMSKLNLNEEENNSDTVIVHAPMTQGNGRRGSRRHSASVNSLASQVNDQGRRPSVHFGGNSNEQRTALSAVQYVVPDKFQLQRQTAVTSRKSANEAKKAAEQDTVMDTYETSIRSLLDDVNNAIVVVADQLEADMAAHTKEMNEYLEWHLHESRLGQWTRENLDLVSEGIRDRMEHRDKLLRDAEQQMMLKESQFARDAQTLVDTLVARLCEINLSSPVDILNYAQTQAIAINKRSLENRQVITDLCGRLLTENVEISRDLAIVGLDHCNAWSTLHYNHILDQFNKQLCGSKVLNAPVIKAAVVDLVTRHTKKANMLFVQLDKFCLLDDLSKVTREYLDNYLKAVSNAHDSMQQMCKQFSDQMELMAESVKQAAHRLAEETLAQLLALDVVPELTVQNNVKETLSQFMERVDVIAFSARVVQSLEEQSDFWARYCRTIYWFMQSLCTLWSHDKIDLEEFRQHLTRRFEAADKTFQNTIGDLKFSLDGLIDSLDTEVDYSHLDGGFDQIGLLVTEIQEQYQAYQFNLEEMISQLPNQLSAKINQFREKVANYFDLSTTPTPQIQAAIAAAKTQSRPPAQRDVAFASETSMVMINPDRPTSASAANNNNNGDAAAVPRPGSSRAGGLRRPGSSRQRPAAAVVVTSSTNDLDIAATPVASAADHHDYQENINTITTSTGVVYYQKSEHNEIELILTKASEVEKERNRENRYQTEYSIFRMLQNKQNNGKGAVNEKKKSNSLGLRSSIEAAPTETDMKIMAMGQLIEFSFTGADDLFIQPSDSRDPTTQRFDSWIQQATRESVRKLRANFLDRLERWTLSLRETTLAKSQQHRIERIEKTQAEWVQYHDFMDRVAQEVYNNRADELMYYRRGFERVDRAVRHKFDLNTSAYEQSYEHLESLNEQYLNLLQSKLSDISQLKTSKDIAQYEAERQQDREQHKKRLKEAMDQAESALNEMLNHIRGMFNDSRMRLRMKPRRENSTFKVRKQPLYTAQIARLETAAKESEAAQRTTLKVWFASAVERAESAENEVVQRLSHQKSYIAVQETVKKEMTTLKIRFKSHLALSKAGEVACLDAVERFSRLAHDTTQCDTMAQVQTANDAILQVLDETRQILVLRTRFFECMAHLPGFMAVVTLPYEEFAKIVAVPTTTHFMSTMAASHAIEHFVKPIMRGKLNSGKSRRVSTVEDTSAGGTTRTASAGSSHASRQTSAKPESLSVTATDSTELVHSASQQPSQTATMQNSIKQTNMDTSPTFCATMEEMFSSSQQRVQQWIKEYQELRKGATPTAALLATGTTGDDAVSLLMEQFEQFCQQQRAMVMAAREQSIQGPLLLFLIYLVVHREQLKRIIQLVKDVMLHRMLSRLLHVSLTLLQQAFTSGQKTLNSALKSANECMQDQENALRPALGHPQQRPALDQLDTKMQTFHQEHVARLDALRQQLHESIVDQVREFARRLAHSIGWLANILDRMPASDEMISSHQEGENTLQKSLESPSQKGALDFPPVLRELAPGDIAQLLTYFQYTAWDNTKGTLDAMRTHFDGCALRFSDAVQLQRTQVDDRLNECQREAEQRYQSWQKSVQRIKALY